MLELNALVFILDIILRVKPGEKIQIWVKLNAHRKMEKRIVGKV